MVKDHECPWGHLFSDPPRYLEGSGGNSSLHTKEDLSYCVRTHTGRLWMKHELFGLREAIYPDLNLEDLADVVDQSSR